MNFKLNQIHRMYVYELVVIILIIKVIFYKKWNFYLWSIRYIFKK